MSYTKVVSICQLLPDTAEQTAGGANGLDTGGDAAHTPGGTSSEMGATAHAEGRKACALQHESAG
jgi:hypothetical protein